MIFGGFVDHLHNHGFYYLKLLRHQKPHDFWKIHGFFEDSQKIGIERFCAIVDLFVQLLII
jgi:hypothetical protein